MKTKKLLSLALAALLAFGMAACVEPVSPGNVNSGNNGNEPDPVALTGSVTLPEMILLGATIEANTENLRGEGTISYVWQTGETADGIFEPIEGITAYSFVVNKTPPDIDEGRFLKVTVTREGYIGSRTSNASEIGGEGRPFTGSVTIPGTIYLGDTVTANTTLLGATGTLSYQWQTAPSAGGAYVNINSATNKNFTVTAGTNVAANRYLRVTITSSENKGNISSNAVVIQSTRPLSGSVSIIPGTIFLGDMVRANTSALSGTGTITYQWQSGASSTGAFTTIANATGRIFEVNSSPPNIAVNRYLRVRVTRAGSSGEIFSTPVQIKAAAARAFIDFSGYTGSADPLTSHQPSPANAGAFALANGIYGNGLRVSNDGDKGKTVISQHGGEMAAQNNDGDFLYFFIDNTTIKGNTGTVTLALTFFDNSSGNINLQYTRSNEAFAGKSIPKSGSNSFITIRVELDNCNFTSTDHNQGAQFRVSGGQIIQRVDIVEGGLPDPLLEAKPPFAASTDFNNMIGKGIAGYQVWFNTNTWHHWRNDGTSGNPGPGNIKTEMWPAGFEDYTGASFRNTDFIMPDGTTARLFNSTDAPIIRTQMEWMRDAGIDGAAVQRFYDGGSDPADSGNAPSYLTIIRDAAEATGRIFYIMYDMSGAGGYSPSVVRSATQWKLDWIYNIERKGLVSSPSYAKADGKPVVCIWGIHAIEDTDNYRYIKIAQAIELINWFRDRGYYVIGGIPDDVFWTRTGTGKDMYALFDMISPWYVGRDVNGQILGGGNWLNAGLKFCSDNPRSWASNSPIAFMPTVWPGFAWTNMSGNSGTPNAIPRDGGQWAWRQIRQYLNRDSANVIRSLYFAMMDEYDEATAWMKAGVDYFDIPVGQYFLTHSADGKWLSSDYYLRLAKVSVDALKKKIAAGGGNTSSGNGYTGPLNETGLNSVTVEHSLGPVFWRNSFERREGRLKYGTSEGGGTPTSVTVRHLQIDVGIPSGDVIGTPQGVTISGTFTTNRSKVEGESDSYTPPSTSLGMVYKTSHDARSGDSAFRLAGSTATGTSSYLYKIADTRIKANSNMVLSFWQKAENSLGANVTVDLLLDNGTYLSATSGYELQGTATVGTWVERKVILPTIVNNRYITAVIVAYRDTGTGGNFATLIDDITIKNQNYN